MAKYRHTDVAAGQSIFLSVNLKEQLLPGTFEQMIDEIIGTRIDISIFDRKYKNDLTGASAVPPAVLLKLIIFGYLNGHNSSRRIWRLSQENIIAKALTGDMSIHCAYFGTLEHQMCKHLNKNVEKMNIIPGI